MLTTIGDKIVEIRPKQIIESTLQIDNVYLTPLNKRSDPHYKYEKKPAVVIKKKIKNEKLPEHASRNTQASA